MEFDRFNVTVISISVLIAIAVLFGMILKVNVDNNDTRREKERTAQVRAEACASIEDEQTRALCIVSVQSDGGNP